MAVTDAPAAAGITQPGIYQMPAEQYHADPVEGRSLSSSEARKLLPPSCPAMFRYEQIHGQEPKREFDIGHAAHKLVLGTGPRLEVIDADNWRKKADQEARDAAYQAGDVPLLAHEYAQVEAMATALHQHPVAKALFDPDGGLAEQNLIWSDHQTGIMRRARLDWLPDTTGRVIIPDYKTCASADIDALAKSVHNFGYHQQADWYLTGCQELGLAGEDAAFVFVCQEKKPPYLVSVIQLDAMALRVGKARNRRALGIYEHCLATDTWPAYSDQIEVVSLPPWVETIEGGDL